MNMSLRHVPSSGVEPERFTARDFLATLCYHSQTISIISRIYFGFTYTYVGFPRLQQLSISYLLMGTTTSCDPIILIVCCGLEYIITNIEILASLIPINWLPIYCFYNLMDTYMSYNFNLGISYILSTHL